MDSFYENDEVILKKLRERHFLTFNKLDIETQLRLLNRENVLDTLFKDVSSYFEGRAGINNFIDNANEIILNHFFYSPLTYKMLSTSKNFEKILRAIALSNNPIVTIYLENSEISSLIINNINVVILIADSICKENSVALFRYILRNFPDKVNLMGNFNEVNQWAIIKDIGKLEFYELIMKNEELFELLDDNVISKIIEIEPFKSYLFSKDQDYVVKILKREIKLSSIFSNDHQLISKLKDIPDVNDYRFLITHINDVAYNNIKRLNWLRYKLSLEFFKDNNIPLEDKHLNNYVNDSILDESMFSKVFQEYSLEEERNIYYDKKVSELTDIFEEYRPLLHNFNEENIRELNKNVNIKKILRDLLTKNISVASLYMSLRELTSNELFEILVDRYFKDVPYNFLLNAINVVNFFITKDLSNFNLTEEQIRCLKERLEIYSTIINFFDLDLESQKEFYHSLNNGLDYMRYFYEDFKLAQMISYQDYNKVVFDPNNSDLLSEELSDDKVKVFELKGEDFYIFSHVTNIKRKDSNVQYNLWNDRLSEFLSDPSAPSVKTFGSSISLTSHKKMESFRAVSEYVTFGFCHLNPNRFAHVYHADSYSWYYERGIGMKKINELETSEDLIAKTKKYNEILYQEIGYFLLDKDVLANYDHFNPSYLICYDEITYKDRLVAERMNIPILLIHTEYYNMEKEDYNDYNNLNEYIDNERDAYNATYKRK